MKARYLGNPSPEDDGPRRVGFAGKTFPRSLFVDVTDVPAGLLAKLQANPFFEVSEDALTGAEAKALEELEVPPEPVAAPAAGNDKASLIVALEAIKAKHPETVFDPKWGVPKLKSALEEARFLHDDED